MTTGDSEAKSSLSFHAAEEFFKEAVVEAVQVRGVDTSEDSLAYVVALLADHARRPALREVDQPFGVRLARAMSSSGGQRFERLRSLGDDVLFISGFYTDHLRHRGLPLDYISDLGSVAYGGVASILRTHAQGAPVVFDELSFRFDAFVEVLRHVADSILADGLRDESDVLALYERWARTGSEALAEALMRMGLTPARGSSGVN